MGQLIAQNESISKFPNLRWCTLGNDHTVYTEVFKPSASQKLFVMFDYVVKHDEKESVAISAVHAELRKDKQRQN